MKIRSDGGSDVSNAATVAIDLQYKCTLMKYQFNN